MAETFKTLEYTGVERNTIGKYAYPIKNSKCSEWYGGSTPMVLSNNATISLLEEYYEGLSFDGVKLVTKEIIDVKE